MIFEGVYGMVGGGRDILALPLSDANLCMNPKKDREIVFAKSRPRMN